MNQKFSELKRNLLKVLPLVSLAMLFGFVSQEPTAHTEKIKIGFLIHDLVSERWQRDMDNFVIRVEELGGEAITKNAYGDVQTQINQGKAMIDDGVKVIAVVAANGTALSELVEYANKAGAKIIAYDRLIKNCNLPYYISFNSVKSGELMAEYVVKLKPKGNYAFINGPVTDNNASLVRKGQMNILQPYIDKGDIKIVLDKSVSAWGPLESLIIMEDFLPQYKTGSLDVVLAASDALSEGVVQALSTNEHFKKTLVTGQDANLTACKNIIMGQQAMSVYKSSKKLGFQAAELAMKLAKNEAVQTNTTINNGKYDVPSILFDPVLVDKNNVKDVVTKEGQIKASDL